jgi:uncharacterized protein (DUF2461 family)
MCAFAGFAAEAFDWFSGLELDNSKHYFAAHRAQYDHSVRGALEAMLEELCEELGGHVKLFRQHRDVRFSSDKSPFKTTTYGVITQRPQGQAALYAQLSSAGLLAGTGYHVLAGDQRIAAGARARRHRPPERARSRPAHLGGLRADERLARPPGGRERAAGGLALPDQGLDLRAPAVADLLRTAIFSIRAR